MSKEAYAEAYESLQKANTELRNLVNKEQQLTSQLHENTMVKEVSGCNRIAYNRGAARALTM